MAEAGLPMRLDGLTTCTCALHASADLRHDFARRERASARSPDDSPIRPSSSPTGPATAAKKFGEEAVEAGSPPCRATATALVDEAADVLYHLLVLLQARGVPLDEVMAELERRTAQSRPRREGVARRA